MGSATQFVQIVTTCPTQDVAREVASQLVEQRLAACAQISGPLESHYRWQGDLQTDTEWRCTAKCLGTRFTEVQEAIQRIHPYDVPQIVAIPLVDVSDDYASWLGAELDRPHDGSE